MKLRNIVEDVIPSPGTYQEWISKRYDERYTGKETTHYLHGVVKAVQPPDQPLIVLDKPSRSPQT